MAITDSEISEIVEERGTLGGSTFSILLKDSDEWKIICYREYRSSPKAKNGDVLRCKRPAGWGTNHLGTGACKFCGGAEKSIKNNITHGRTARITREELAAKIDGQLADKEELTNLEYELAATRAVFEEFMEAFPDTDDDSYGRDLHRMTTLVGTIGSLVDKMSRIETRHTITANQIIYVRRVVADIMMKFIPDPDDRTHAVQELATRLGGRTEYAVIEAPVDEELE